MNRVFFLRRHCLCPKRSRFHTFLLIGVLLFTLLISSVFGQTEVQNIAVVVNALTHPDLGITTSLSIIDLAEADAKRAVANDVVPLGNVPNDLVIRGHLAYVTNVFSDNILIINLQRREIVDAIAFRAGAHPQKLAFVNENKMYVTCEGVDEVQVVDVAARRVTKAITNVFNKPVGITILNGKAYVTNAAWEYDTVAQAVRYHQSSLTIIDTVTDTVLKTLPMPTNAGEILNDSESTVIVKTTGDYNLILGNLVFIDATTDEIVETVKLRMTPGSFAINSQKHLFILGGFPNRGIFIYDVAGMDWIRGLDTPIVDENNGWGMAFAPDDTLYIAYPDWGGGGQDVVRVVGTDEAFHQTYRVGHGASVVAIAQLVIRSEDVNDDGLVDITDLKIISQNFGQRGPGIRGDVNKDGKVDILDLVRVAQHF